MSEELQELHRQVNGAKTKRAALIKEIKRLKTESGMKLEAIVRSQVLFEILLGHFFTKKSIGEEKCIEYGSKGKNK